MTQVCLVGSEDVNLQYELLSRETARNALATYDLQEPFENTVVVETVSLGAAVALLNDLNWYLVRFTDATFVRDPSISESDWLSRDLASAIRDEEANPEETGRFLKVYGIVEPEQSDPPAENTGSAADGTADHDTDGDEDGTQADDADTGPAADQDGSSGQAQQVLGTESGPPRLVEPMLLTRTGETIPEYDLRDVDDTLVVRVTEAEFGA